METTKRSLEWKALKDELEKRYKKEIDGLIVVHEKEQAKNLKELEKRAKNQDYTASVICFLAILLVVALIFLGLILSKVTALEKDVAEKREIIQYQQELVKRMSEDPFYLQKENNVSCVLTCKNCGMQFKLY
jgi:hypothetical protein